MSDTAEKDLLSRHAIHGKTADMCMHVAADQFHTTNDVIKLPFTHLPVHLGNDEDHLGDWCQIAPLQSIYVATFRTKATSLGLLTTPVDAGLKTTLAAENRRSGDRNRQDFLESHDQLPVQ